MSNLIRFEPAGKCEAGSTGAQATSAGLAAAEINPPGVEVDVDDMIREFSSRISRLNQEFARRSRELQGLTLRQSRLKQLRRAHKNRSDQWRRERAGQALDLRNQLAALEARRTEQDGQRAELERRSGSLLAEQHRLEDEARRNSIERERLKADDEAQRSRQQALDAAGSTLRLEQGRVLDERARVREREAELAGWRDRLQQEAAALETARDNLARDGEAFHERQREFSAECIRREAQLAQSQAELAAAEANLDERQRALKEAEVDLHRRQDDYAGLEAAQNERHRVLEEETAQLSAKARAHEEALATFAAERDAFNRKQKETEEEQNRLRTEHSHACRRLESDRAALETARALLATETAALEYGRAALGIDQEGQRAEAARIALARTALESDQKNLETALAGHRERELSLQRNEADLQERTGRLEDENRRLETVRQELESQERQLTIHRGDIEELIASQTAERNRLTLEQDALREAQELLGGDLIRLLVDQRSRAASQETNEAARDDLDRALAQVDAEREALRRERAEYDRKSAELSAFGEQIEAMRRLDEEEKATLVRMRLEMEELSRALSAQSPVDAPPPPRAIFPEDGSEESQTDPRRVARERFLTPEIAWPGAPRLVPPETANDPAVEQDSPLSSPCAVETAVAEDEPAVASQPAAPADASLPRECDSVAELVSEYQRQRADQSAMRQVANSAARSAVARAEKKRLFTQLVWQIPMLLFAFSLAGVLLALRERWIPAWSSLAFATLIIGVIGTGSLLAGIAAKKHSETDRRKRAR